MGMVHRRRCQSLPCVRGGGTVLCAVTEGGAYAGCGADFDMSIPQSALRLTAPFTQGSRGAGRTYGAQSEPPEESTAFPPHPPNKVRHLLLKEKASPYGDAKIPSEAGLAPPRAPLRLRYTWNTGRQKAYRPHHQGRWRQAQPFHLIRQAELATFSSWRRHRLTAMQRSHPWRALPPSGSPAAQIPLE